MFLQPIEAEKLRGWTQPFHAARAQLLAQQPGADRAELLADLAVAMMEWAGCQPDVPLAGCQLDVEFGMKHNHLG